MSGPKLTTIKDIIDYYDSLPTAECGLRFSHGLWPCVVNADGSITEPEWRFEDNAPPPYNWM